MERNYCKHFEVHYYEVNKYREATPVSILNYLEEAAIAHSEDVGLGLDRLKSEGIGWVLNRWHLVMERYPVWGEQVKVETWPSRFERFYATREFLLQDTVGNVLGKATSLWIFLSLEKKRPLRIPPEFAAAYGLDPVRAIEGEFAGFPALELPESSREFNIRRSDIDTNQHVNNTKYVEWMLEAVPQAVYDNFVLNTLEVAYKKEIGYGLAVTSAVLTEAESERDYRCGHRVFSRDGAELAAARTVWTKR